MFLGGRSVVKLTVPEASYTSSTNFQEGWLQCSIVDSLDKVRLVFSRMQIETVTQHRHISLCHIWCLVDKLVALSGFKWRCFSSLFTILVATVTFVGISTLYIFFSLWGESLCWKLFLTKCSYPTEYYWGLVLVCNAVCKLSRYEWFAFSWCGQMQYFLSIRLTKMRLPRQCLWQKSDTKAFLSAIGYCYCNFRKSCWC